MVVIFDRRELGDNKLIYTVVWRSRDPYPNRVADKLEGYDWLAPYQMVNAYQMEHWKLRGLWKSARDIAKACITSTRQVTS
jgi:hypothetical protein